MITEVKGTESYYGYMSLRVADDSFQWGIPSYDGTSWTDISEETYNALMKHNEEYEK